MSASQAIGAANFVLDDSAAEKLTSMLSDEGVMRAGFIIHEANNFHSPEDSESSD